MNITEIEKENFTKEKPIHFFTVRCEKKINETDSSKYYWFATVNVWGEKTDYEVFCPICKSTNMVLCSNNYTIEYEENSYNLWSKPSGEYICKTCNPSSDDIEFIKKTVWIHTSNEKRTFHFIIEKKIE